MTDLSRRRFLTGVSAAAVAATLPAAPAPSHGIAYVSMQGLCLSDFGDRLPNFEIVIPEPLHRRIIEKVGTDGWVYRETEPGIFALDADGIEFMVKPNRMLPVGDDGEGFLHSQNGPDQARSG